MASVALLGSASRPFFDDDDIGYEIVRGQRVEAPPMSPNATNVASILLGMMMMRGSRPQGRANTETLYLIDRAENIQRRPDLAFVSYTRWPRNQPVPSTNAWDVVPNLAVEVISPTNVANELLTKLHEYFRCGVELVWIVYPLFEQIYVYTSPTSVRILDRASDLDAGTLLPGFQLSLSELFERPEETPA